MHNSILIGSKRKSEIFENLLANSGNFNLLGFIDPDDTSNYNFLGDFIVAMEYAQKADVFFVDRAVEALPFDLIANLVKFGKHIFFDGYRHWEFGSWESLQKYSTESGSIIQFSHILHNKPLFTSAAQLVKKPRFIKIEKYCVPPVNGKLSLWFFQHLFQEIDLVLRTINSTVRSIHARPIFLFGNQADLLNIQLEFSNDAIAVISVGRAVEPGTFTMNIYQKDRLFSVDFTDNTLKEFRTLENSNQLTLHEELSNDVSESSDFKQLVKIDRVVMPFDIWKMEIRNFQENIEKRLTPISSIDNGYEVTFLIEQIIERIQRKYQEV
jgi:hypothetical protein